MKNLPDTWRAASSHFNGQKLQNKPEETGKASCPAPFGNSCVFLFLVEGQANELPDLKTSVTVLKEPLEAQRERKQIATPDRTEEFNRNRWHALSLARTYMDTSISLLKQRTFAIKRSQRIHPENKSNTNGSVFLPQIARWGKHITLILIFWLFDNRQPLVLFLQPSNRPYLHVAGLTDFN